MESKNSDKTDFKNQKGTLAARDGSRVHTSDCNTVQGLQTTKLYAAGAGRLGGPGGCGQRLDTGVHSLGG